jgi:hypothetical protein
MMKKQTAVEWLMQEMFKSKLNGYYEKLLIQAKQMEREQIFKACDFGRAYGYNQATGYPNHIHNPEQYYNETYSK